jgi:hypothetical protein
MLKIAKTIGMTLRYQVDHNAMFMFLFYGQFLLTGRPQHTVRCVLSGSVDILWRILTLFWAWKQVPAAVAAPVTIMLYNTETIVEKFPVLVMWRHGMRPAPNGSRVGARGGDNTLKWGFLQSILFKKSRTEKKLVSFCTAVVQYRRPGQSMP